MVRSGKILFEIFRHKNLKQSRQQQTENTEQKKQSRSKWARNSAKKKRELPQATQDTDKRNWQSEKSRQRLPKLDKTS